jgi:EmrB/QacA subfamily drug resistance transporter
MHISLDLGEHTVAGQKIGWFGSPAPGRPRRHPQGLIMASGTPAAVEDTARSDGSASRPGAETSSRRARPQAAARPATAPPRAAHERTRRAAAGQRTESGGWLLPLVVVVVGMFMSILDTSIVNVATPAVSREFGATTDQVQWIATAYNLTLGVVVPVSGWLGDRYGLERVYTIALVGFALGSALCGLAWNLNVLILFRILQAIGGGVLPAITMAMVYRIVPREKIGVAMGLYGLGVLFAPAVGPTLGGYLIEYVNWRLIFTINVPVGVVGVVVAIMVLPRFPRRAKERFDALGFATVATGLFALLLALSEGQSWGWSSYRILILTAIGAFSLALFTVIELSVEQPLIDLRVFRYTTFLNSTAIIGVLSVGLFAGFFYVPLFLQEGQGLGALQAGVMLLPEALVMGLMMPISGKLYDLIGARWPGALGLVVVSVGTYLMHSISLSTSRLEIVLWMVIRSAGLGLAMMPVMTGGMTAIPPELTARASAMSNIVQRVAGALGLALLTAVLVSHQDQQAAGRAALMPADLSPYQSIGAQGQSGVLGLYNSVQLQSFGGAIADVLLLTAGTSAICVLLALMMPSRPSGKAMDIMAASEASPAEGTNVDGGGHDARAAAEEVNGHARAAPASPLGPKTSRSANGATVRVRPTVGGNSVTLPRKERGQRLGRPSQR